MGGLPPIDVLLARAKRAPPLYVCVVWCVVFYVSVLLCGARVLDDVRREAQAGQRTRKARSQVLPCKPRYSACACWLRKDLQKKSTFPKKVIIFTNLGYNLTYFNKKTLKMRSPVVLVRSSTCPMKNEYGQVRGELQRIISDRVMIKTFVGH